MKMIAGLYVIILRTEILGTSSVMCAHALGDAPIPSRGYGLVHQWAGSNHYVLHNVSVTVTSSNGVSGLRSPKVCSPDKESGPTVCKLTRESILALMGCV